MTRLFWMAALAVVCSLSAVAQGMPVLTTDPLGELRKYLNLSDAQSEVILRNNRDLMIALQAKSVKVAQLSSEINVEMAKEKIDPSYIGVRHVEVAYLSREIATETAKTRARNAAVLTASQAAKIKALEDAHALQGIISQADGCNLIQLPLVPVNNLPVSRAGVATGFASFLLGPTMPVGVGQISFRFPCIADPLQGLPNPGR